MSLFAYSLSFANFFLTFIDLIVIVDLMRWDPSVILSFVDDLHMLELPTGDSFFLVGHFWHQQDEFKQASFHSLFKSNYTELHRAPSNYTELQAAVRWSPDMG